MEKTIIYLRSIFIHVAALLPRRLFPFSLPDDPKTTTSPIISLFAQMGVVILAGEKLGALHRSGQMRESAAIGLQFFKTVSPNLQIFVELRKLPQDKKDEYKKYMTTEKDTREYWEEQVSDARIEGFAEGVAQGKEEGEAKGRADSKLDIARVMKAKGLDTSIIVECTGLGIETIEEL